MLFNSFEFLIFFFIVFALYLILRHKQQNILLLIASYIFYGAWNWKFLFLLFISTAMDFYFGLMIYNTKNQKKKNLFLTLSIAISLIILGFFKYFNFFAVSLQKSFMSLNIHTRLNLLEIVLPVGISFYTFQTMGYVIDVYRGTIKPTSKFFDFALFISFFPQLVAGPIERAKDLIPQIVKNREITVNRVNEGIYFIFWGLFQKIFIADNLAIFVDSVFEKNLSFNGSVILLTIYAFSFQIYCDFAGYSNIAVGVTKLLGFDLRVNFNLPYFSTNPRDLWKRWHITLSTWLRDYVYKPLKNKSKSKLNTARNILITMLLCGLWHGASWTKILWGLYHGILLILYVACEPFLTKIKVNKPKILFLLIRIIFFFQLWCLGLLMFRANSLNQFYAMLISIFSNFKIEQDFINYVLYLFYFTFFLIIYESIQFVKKDSLFILKSSVTIKIIFALVIIYQILYTRFLAENATIIPGRNFVYFQF